MTEAEWLASDDPEAMYATAKEFFRTDYPHGPRTARKRDFEKHRNLKDLQSP